MLYNARVRSEEEGDSWDNLIKVFQRVCGSYEHQSGPSDKLSSGFVNLYTASYCTYTQLHLSACSLRRVLHVCCKICMEEFFVRL